MAYAFVDEEPTARYQFVDEPDEPEGAWEGLVKPTLKAMFLGEEDLGGANDHALDRGVEDNLPGDGIESHLVVGFVLVEVVS